MGTLRRRSIVRLFSMYSLVGETRVSSSWRNRVSTNNIARSAPECSTRCSATRRIESRPIAVVHARLSRSRLSRGVDSFEKYLGGAQLWLLDDRETRKRKRFGSFDGSRRRRVATRTLSPPFALRSTKWNCSPSNDTDTVRLDKRVTAYAITS